MPVFENILETVGRTPVVKLGKIAPPHVEIYAKLEAFNPMGSVKDRLALACIEAAEKSGDLKPGQTVVEATSGNTGIGLAMVCARKGYPLVIVMAENFSVERRRLMRFLGARVVLTPAALKGSGMLEKARELAQANGWFLVRQFENEANADAHSRTTAREILADFDGRRLDYWVTGFGTGGTLKGVARVLKAERPEVKIIGCEPDNAPIVRSGVAQERRDDGSPAASHPMFRPHLMQGWAPDFIPKLTGDAVDAGMIDELAPINGEVAIQTSKALAQLEGVFTGITGGATLAGALEKARTAPKGSVFLCMLPDTGERYLSTQLFDDVPAEMTAEEIEISGSTPYARFDAPPPSPAPAAAAAPPAVDDPQAEAWLAEAIGGAPVVMFALEWCEFCGSVRRFFDDAGIDFASVDLDSVAYEADDRGLRIRQALQAKTGCVTIPQIFIGGEFIGGCTDVFDAHASGDLRRRLEAAGVRPLETADLSPESYLPKWLHPRR